MWFGLLVSIFVSVWSVARAHSWLDCLQWDMESGQCLGFPRNWANRMATPFGQDVGRDSQPGVSITEANGGLFCDTPFTANSYTPAYPMATVPAGGDLRMRWPAKNHANVPAGPGTVEMLISSRRPDAAQATDYDDFSLITSKSGYLSACEAAGGICQAPFASHPTNSDCQTPGVDRAECIASFRLPKDILPGTYTIMWWWEFNPGQYYHSCADMVVTQSTGDSSDGGDDDSSIVHSGETLADRNGPNTIGIVVGVLACVGIAAFAFIFALRERRKHINALSVQQTSRPSTTHAPRGTSFSPSTPAQPLPTSVWSAQRDPISGCIYYYNHQTGESTWTKPNSQPPRQPAPPPPRRPTLAWGSTRSKVAVAMAQPEPAPVPPV